MVTARSVWPSIPADFDPKSLGDTLEWFAFDCTLKLAELASNALTGTPTIAAYLPEAPTTPVTDFTFGTPVLLANSAGLADQVVAVQIGGGADNKTYKVTVTFMDTAGRTLERSQLLAISDR